MHRRMCAFGLILLTVATSSSILLACGDKFLISNRGTRFQRAGALREPAAILIYTNPASELQQVLGGATLDATLRKAGYRPTMVATPDDFEKALNRSGWDLVLVSAADATAVSSRLPKNVAVVPVVVNATNAELMQTRKQYKIVLKAPAKGQSLLSVIDEALRDKRKLPRKSM
jgi:hypothetical protein